MGCIKSPHVSLSLPFPLAIPDIGLPGGDLDVNLCCRVKIGIHPPPIPISALLAQLGPLGIASILTYVDLLNALLDALPPSCPLD